jgi:phosphatidylserine decarboxylase
MKDYILKHNYIIQHGLKTLIIPIFLLFFGIIIKNLYIILISIGLIAICINFFKRPNFEIEKNNNLILAPSFGRIQKIMKINNNIYISIFLSLFDPHIQYIPYDGFLINQIYKNGTFRAAFLFEKSTFNERMIHNIVTKIGTISVVQIAGMIARTIVPFLKQQTRVVKGDELGMIKFGSRVDIIIPIQKNMKILIKQGQYVYGGQTPLIRIDK